jgi:hypothetical protein
LHQSFFLGNRRIADRPEASADNLNDASRRRRAGNRFLTPSELIGRELGVEVGEDTVGRYLRVGAEFAEADTLRL